MKTFDPVLLETDFYTDNGEEITIKGTYVPADPGTRYHADGTGDPPVDAYIDFVDTEPETELTPDEYDRAERELLEMGDQYDENLCIN